jgi:hypothetical protein
MKHLIRVDEKVSGWERNTYEVEAEAYEEALHKIISLIETNDYPEDSDGVTMIDSEYLYDTEERMAVDDNDGCGTIEVLDKDYYVYWDNVNKYEIH